MSTKNTKVTMTEADPIPKMVPAIQNRALLYESKLVIVKALESAVAKKARSKEWIALEDVPEEYGIKRSAEWLRDKWRRQVGAPRPSKVANGVYSVRRAEIETWLDDLRAEDQEAVLRRGELTRRQASGEGRLRLAVPDPRHG